MRGIKMDRWINQQKQHLICGLRKIFADHLGPPLGPKLLPWQPLADLGHVRPLYRFGLPRYVDDTPRLLRLKFLGCK